MKFLRLSLGTFWFLFASRIDDESSSRLYWQLVLSIFQSLKITMPSAALDTAFSYFNLSLQTSTFHTLSTYRRTENSDPTK